MGNCQERKVIDMTMTRKQHKALMRHKAIVRKHNIKQCNKPKGGSFLQILFNAKNSTYRLYDI